MEGPPKRLGILMLHGMGEHRRGDTLRRFGEPIYAWLDSWRAASEPACKLFVDDSSLRLPRLDDPEAPPHTRITITWPDTENPDGPPEREQTWIAAEAWWADEFNPPPFSEVASWSMALAPGLLVNYVGVGLRRSRFWTWLALPLGYLAAGLFQLILLALLVVGIVPQLRGFVAGIQVKLTGALGDPLVMVASPIRFNAILTRIERNLRWLREDQGCERIAVVAHSQGTGIGLRVLQRRSDRVLLFITFGTAIEKLHIAAELQAIRRRLSGAITFSAVCLVLIVAAWIVAVVVFDQPLLWWIVACVAGMLVVGGVITVWSGKQIAKVGSPDLTIPVQSEDGEVAETAPLVWHDFWTISDPFPDEDLPLPSEGPTPPHLRHIDRVSHEVYNRSALLKDHSIYQENHEGLVGPVFVQLAALAELEAGLPERLTPALADAAGRRKIRVGALGFSRWIVGFAAILLPLLSIARGELVSIGRPIRTLITSLSGWLGIKPIVDALDD